MILHDSCLKHAMTQTVASGRALRLLSLAAALTAALLLAAPDPASALSHYWGRHPDKERLVVVFPEAIPAYSVKRTGKREITLSLPQGYWQQDDKPQPGIFNTATLLQDVNVVHDSAGGAGLQILLKTEAFGYIQFPLRDRGKLVIDVFKDPIGAKWTPGQSSQAAAKPSPAPESKPQQAKATPKPAQVRKSVEPPAAPKPPAVSETSKPAEAAVEAASAHDAQEARPRADIPEPRPEPKQAPLQDATPQAPQAAEQKPASQPEPEPAAAQQAAPSQPAPADMPARTAEDSAAPASTAEAPDTPEAQASAAEAQKGGESLETLKKQFEEVRSRPTSEPPRAEGTAPQRSKGSRSFFSVPYSYRAPIKDQGPDAVQPRSNSGSDAGGRAPTSGDQSSSLESPPQRGLLRFLDEALSVPPAYAVEQEAANDAEAPAPTGAQAAADADTAPVNSDDTAQLPGEAAPGLGDAGDAAPEVQNEGFSVRARMAPPETTTPTPVLAPARSPAGTAEREAELPQPGVEQSAVPAAQEPAAAQPEAAQEAAAPEDATPEVATPEAAQDAQTEAAGDQPQRGEEERAPAEPVAENLEPAAPQAREAADGEPDPNAPPDFEEVILAGRAALANEDYQNALDVFEGIKNHPLLPEALRTDVLYNYADALYALSKNTMRENYAKLTTAYTEAMNSDLDEMRVPDALFKLGVLNLKVNSPDQARAYFNILKKRYPDDDRIPLTNYYWGEYYYDHEDFQKAADEFQYIVQKYPDNRFVREASVGLARSLNKLGYVDQAQEIVDYIEKRWPRYYVEYPPLLQLFGDVHYKAGLLDKAKLNYWTYYNMDPEAEGADLLLARLGDIYLELGDMETAKEVYDMAVQKFPDSEGGLIAQMRLAEQGVYDTPSIQDMFSVFDRPYTRKPVEVYESIVNDYPNSELAPLAQLKLAMWYLWNDKLPEAMEAASDFERKFPGNELLESARNVALSAFDKLTDRYVREQNYVPLVELWENTPILQGQQDDLAPETRLGLATSLWKTGEMQKARNLLDPFFMGAAMPKHSENALMLAMAICLDDRDWQCIVDLARRTELWDISPRVHEEMQYNLALAYENLDQPEKSAPLWAELAGREDIDLNQMAYIHYFLAHKARDDGDYKRAYDLGQNSLGTFLEERSDQQKIKDLLALLMDVTRKTGRTREALKWAIEYSRYINKSDPEWPALRYQMAQLYRQLADNQKWEAILTELVEDKPNSLYGRMAASDLKTRKLEENARQFSPSVGGL